MTRFLILSALVVGCGGKTDDTSTTTDAATDTTASGDGSTVTDTTPVTLPDGAPLDFCAAAAERAVRCETGTFSAVQCEQQLRCFKNVARPADLSPLLTCLSTRECGVKDDDCIAKRAMNYISDPVVQAYVKTCNEKRTACSAGGMSTFSDDYCGFDHGVMNDDVRAKMKSCVERSCAEIRDCFDTVLAAVGCNN